MEDSDNGTKRLRDDPTVSTLAESRHSNTAAHFSKKKLIEVTLPLEAINVAAAREKSIRHGHPSTLHLWWARRPLAAARAVIFSQMVDDPSVYLSDPAEIENERKRLFKIIEDLVVWENTTNKEVLEKARAEIRKSCERNGIAVPAFHDPFAGGGALPLEAQRLGLESFASDLNPVAVLINKAMIEIPPRFAGQRPVSAMVHAKPRSQSENAAEDFRKDWSGAAGLAEDVRFYGNQIREEAQKRIGHLYPTVKDSNGNERTVIAWLWARTVHSPNPAFRDAEVPLASTFVLSSKAGKEAFVEPVVNGNSYTFTVKYGKPPAEAENGTKMPGKGANFRCLLSSAPISGDYIKAEGKAGRMGARLMALVCEGDCGRIYLAPPAGDNLEKLKIPFEKPEQQLIGKCRDQLPLYGYETHGDLFTPRQLVALTCFFRPCGGGAGENQGGRRCRRSRGR